MAERKDKFVWKKGDVIWDKPAKKRAPAKKKSGAKKKG